MKRLMDTVFAGMLVLALFAPADASAQRRRVVRVRHPRAALVVHPGHPIRRVLPATVVVRPARKVVLVKTPRVFLPAVVWTAAVVTLPAREHLSWQDSETIESYDGWVDTNFGIDAKGNALVYKLLNFADGRQVMTVRLLAQSKSDETKFSVYLSK